ncbi:14814_t:CDS:2, partial [Funneliformis geosporum]
SSNTKAKRFVFPPPEEFERVVKRAQRSHRRTNILLHPNASAAERVKYNLCKNIARYERENNLTEKELAKKLGITHSRVEKILFCHIDELDLEELPTNLREYKCDLVIDNQHFTVLEISPYYEKHNHEYLEALKRKGIKVSAKELASKLITDDLIRKVLVPQLDGEIEITVDGVYYQYTYYFAVPYQGNKAYKLI